MPNNTEIGDLNNIKYKNKYLNSPKGESMLLQKVLNVVPGH